MNCLCHLHPQYYIALALGEAWPDSSCDGCGNGPGRSFHRPAAVTSVIARERPRPGGFSESRPRCPLTGSRSGPSSASVAAFPGEVVNGRDAAVGRVHRHEALQRRVLAGAHAQFGVDIEIPLFPARLVDELRAGGFVGELPIVAVGALQFVGGTGGRRMPAEVVARLLRARGPGLEVPEAAVVGLRDRVGEARGDVHDQIELAVLADFDGVGTAAR